MEETLRQIMKRKSGLTDLEYNKWIGNVHREATGERNKKIKEVFSKENPTEMEIELVNRWSEMFDEL